MAVKRPPKKELMILIEENFGVLARVAKILGVSRSVVAGWARRDKTGDYATARENGKEMFIDFAENQAIKAMSNGNTAVILKILSTIGKSRGYVEQKRFDPNLIGDLAADQTTSGDLEITIKSVIIDSRQGLEEVYKGDQTKAIELKNIDDIVNTIDEKFLERP